MDCHHQAELLLGGRTMPHLPAIVLLVTSAGRDVFDTSIFAGRKCHKNDARHVKVCCVNVLLLCLRVVEVAVVPNIEGFVFRCGSRF